MPTAESSLMSAVARVERDRMDERLDEALGETFPASDPVAITPVKREPGDDDVPVPGTAKEKPSVSDAPRNTHRRPGHEENRS